MPQYSYSDRTRIVELMESGRLFALVPGVEERKELLDRLLVTPGRILSLNTLIHDTLYLERPARAFRSLLPQKFKGSLKHAMLRQHQPRGTHGQCEIQISEHEFRTVPVFGSSFSLAMTQLWLFALRHFVSPHAERKSKQEPADWPIEPRSLSKMAILADRFGFTSNKIKELRQTDVDGATMEQFLRAICREEFYMVEDGKIRLMALKFKEYLRNLSRRQEKPRGTPMFSTHDPDKMAHRRYNSPRVDEYERDRAYLFVENIYSPSQSPGQYPTSFAVTREIFFSFFGRKPPYAILSQGDAPMPPGPAQAEGADSQQPNEGAASLQHTATGTPVQNNQRGEGTATPSVEDMSVHDELPELVVSEPVDLEPHPPGTPDRFMDGVEIDPPLAHGFEDYTCKAPLEKRAEISLHRSATQVLDMWRESDNRDLIVLYMFESRGYIKFLAQGGLNLRLTLNDLGRDHYFLTINGDEVEAPENVYDDALEKRLVLVGRRDAPSHEIGNGYGQISLSELREYLSAYAVQTGKRKLEDNSSQSRAKHHLAG